MLRRPQTFNPTHAKRLRVSSDQARGRAREQRGLMPQGMLAAALVGVLVFGGVKATKAAAHGVKKAGHAIVHVLKKL